MILVLLLFFWATTISATSTSAELDAFVTIAQRCKQSLKEKPHANNDDEETFARDELKKVCTFYDYYKKELQNHTQLEPHQAATLVRECTDVLRSSLSAVTKSAALTSSPLSLTQAEHLFSSAMPGLISANQFALKEFVTLAQHCKTSQQSTADAPSFAAFKRIYTFYLENRARFAAFKKKELSPEAIDDLAQDCSWFLQDATLKFTKAPRRAINEEQPLQKSIEQFRRTVPQLLAPIKIASFGKRLLFLTMIEVAVLSVETQWLKRERGRKKVPSFRERFTKATQIDWGRYGKAVALGLGRLGAYTAVDECMRKGIMTPWHKVLEVVVPRILAGIIVCTCLSAPKGAMSLRIGQRLANTLILSKLFLPASHPLYKPLAITSYVYPFIFGKTGLSGGWDLAHISDPNTWANMAFDGAASFGIFTALPHAIGKLIPKDRMPLNPHHRRKAITNAVRELFDKGFSTWNDAAFTA